MFYPFAWPIFAAPPNTPDKPLRNEPEYRAAHLADLLPENEQNPPLQCWATPHILRTNSSISATSRPCQQPGDGRAGMCLEHAAEWFDPPTRVFA